MEAADAHLHARRAQGTRDVHDARELVRLHADEADQRPAAGGGDLPDDVGRADARVGLVDGEDFGVDVRPERARLDRLPGDAVEAGERV